MEIEWLRFRVDEAHRETFVQQDETIWTSTLSSYDGFLGKEVWINPNDRTEVITVIRWRDMESWNAIPLEVLDATEQAFSAAMGPTYELMDSRHYQVRKFAQ